MNVLDDLPIFQPRMGRDHRASSRSAGSSFRHALLSAARRGAWSARGEVGSARSRVAVARPGQGARRVVIKAHVARMSAGGAKAAALHLRYIGRDGVEKDGLKGRLYTAEGLRVSRRSTSLVAASGISFGLSCRPRTPASSTSPTTSGG